MMALIVCVYLIDILQVVRDTVYFVGENELFSRLRTILVPNKVFPTQITVKSILHTIRQIWDVLEECERT